MANPAHLQILRQGVEAWNQWRKQHEVIFPGLGEANLSGADLIEANLSRANLSGADLGGADLYRADLSGANLSGANLSGANLSGANLTLANLFRANLGGADLYRADFSEANLGRANLGRANLGRANLSEADVHRADFSEADLSRANLRDVRNAHQAFGLEYVYFRLDETRNTSPEGQASLNTSHSFLNSSSSDALYFETSQRRWWERWLDWERLRMVGRLPLFGASYSGLIFIPIIFYGLALYNDKVTLVRAWAEQALLLPDHNLYRLASLVLARLHPQPIPQQSLLLLVSTVLLAVGSTLYTFFCPSRVKEFSRDQWCDQLGRSLVHYWPVAWRHRIIRLICTACYALGGAGVLWVLGTKVWRVLLFILKYSPSPWPWR